MDPQTHDGTQRVALVTGSARRLGRAIAEDLCRRGFAVVVHARDGQRAATAAQEMGAAFGIGGDLALSGTPAQLIDAVIERSGRLDLLVNSAATFAEGAFDALSIDETLTQWHEAFDVNTRAPALLAVAARPHLAEVRGAIINISDRAAFEHWATRPLHSASKAALDSLTISLARALAPEIAVYGIAPNAVLPPDDMTASAVAALVQRPGGVGEPADVTAALHTLLADRSRSGETLVLTGAAGVPFTVAAAKEQA